MLIYQSSQNFYSKTIKLKSELVYMKVMKITWTRFNIWKRKILLKREHRTTKKATLCHEIIHGLDDICIASV